MRCGYLKRAYDSWAAWGCNGKALTEAGLKEKGYDATCHHTDCTVTDKFQLINSQSQGRSNPPLPLLTKLVKRILMSIRAMQVYRPH